ncbi:oligosaccharide flippase family protein [uncultured Lamprocystis sp.]|jgi:O-antigen/teichoic acid export membrane protein|uniref:oligosaccharide flippase family protein n=1 Tax=uncultured Lamprocystis sp. TaxID=543132 RepID=UPI0025E73E8B|nr:oligosaccharide flippase family protein [uncultured Lamprocystis sp.]
MGLLNRGKTKEPRGAGQGRASSVVINTVTNYGRQLTNVTAFLVITPIIADRLGNDAFGLWSVLQATIGLLGLLDFGFSVSVVKFVAETRGQGNADRLQRITATLFGIYVMLGLLVISLALGLVPFLPELLNIPADKTEVAQVAFILVALRSALAAPMGMFFGILTGFQLQSWANMVQILGTVLYTAAAAWALMVLPSLETLAAVGLVTGVITCLFAVVLCAAKCAGISFRFRHFDRRLVREISSFSVSIFLIQVSGFIYTRIDALIIQQFLTLSAVAYYTVASRMATEASGLCRQLTNALTPLVAEMQGQGQKDRIRITFERGSKLSLAFATPLLVGLFWYGGDVLAAWMGEDYRSAETALRILLAAMLCSVVHANAANILSMTGHQKFLAYAFIAGQAANLGMTLAMVVPFGINGVALATLISTVVVDMGIVQPKAARMYRLTFSSYYRAAVLPSALACIPMLVTFHFAEQFLQPHSLRNIAFIEALGTLVFLGSFLLFGMNAQERRYYWERLPKKR